MDIFIAEWENSYHKAKKVGCEYSDMIQAFKLLKDAKLNEIETKLVLTGVNYVEGKAKGDLCDQIKVSLKKFKGRSVILDENSRSDMESMESVLIAKGWKPPQSKQRRRSRSESPPRRRTNDNMGRNDDNTRSVSPQRPRNEKYEGRKPHWKKSARISCQRNALNANATTQQIVTVPVYITSRQTVQGLRKTLTDQKPILDCSCDRILKISWRKTVMKCWLLRSRLKI